MKNFILLFVLVLLLTVGASAQLIKQPTLYFYGNRAAAPPCAVYPSLYFSTVSSRLRVCSNNTGWTDLLDATNNVVTVAGKTGNVTLAANDINSGVFPTARLGTGLLNNTAFLRGNGVFSSLTAADVPNLDAAKITSGVFPISRLPFQVSNNALPVWTGANFVNSPFNIENLPASRFATNVYGDIVRLGKPSGTQTALYLDTIIGQILLTTNKNGGEYGLRVDGNSSSVKAPLGVLALGDAEDERNSTKILIDDVNQSISFNAANLQPYSATYLDEDLRLKSAYLGQRQVLVGTGQGAPVAKELVGGRGIAVDESEDYLSFRLSNLPVVAITNIATIPNDTNETLKTIFVKDLGAVYLPDSNQTPGAKYDFVLVGQNAAIRNPAGGYPVNLASGDTLTGNQKMRCKQSYCSATLLFDGQEFYQVSGVGLMQISSF